MPMNNGRSYYVVAARSGWFAALPTASIFPDGPQFLPAFLEDHVPIKVHEQKRRYGHAVRCERPLSVRARAAAWACLFCFSMNASAVARKDFLHRENNSINGASSQLQVISKKLQDLFDPPAISPAGFDIISFHHVAHACMRIWQQHGLSLLVGPLRAIL